MIEKKLNIFIILINLVGFINLLREKRKEFFDWLVK